MSHFRLPLMVFASMTLAACGESPPKGAAVVQETNPERHDGGVAATAGPGQSGLVDGGGGPAEAGAGASAVGGGPAGQTPAYGTPGAAPNEVRSSPGSSNSATSR
jgi:hypothetical protein